MFVGFFYNGRRETIGKKLTLCRITSQSFILNENNNKDENNNSILQNNDDDDDDETYLQMKVSFLFLERHPALMQQQIRFDSTLFVVNYHYDFDMIIIIVAMGMSLEFCDVFFPGFSDLELRGATFCAARSTAHQHIVPTRKKLQSQKIGQLRFVVVVFSLSIRCVFYGVCRRLLCRSNRTKLWHQPQSLLSARSSSPAVHNRTKSKLRFSLFLTTLQHQKKKTKHAETRQQSYRFQSELCWLRSVHNLCHGKLYRACATPRKE